MLRVVRDADDVVCKSKVVVVVWGGGVGRGRRRIRRTEMLRATKPSPLLPPAHIPDYMSDIPGCVYSINYPPEDTVAGG